LNLPVEVVNRSGIVLDEEAVACLAGEVLRGLAACGFLTVAFLPEDEMADLNGRYRGVGEPTDVLSFPETSPDEEWPEPEEEVAHLGDILICPAYALRNAADESVSPDEELRVLLVHGVLHILGHDHETDEGQMLAWQAELLSALPRPRLLREG
jgi:probable rRNA maturation factor